MNTFGAEDWGGWLPQAVSYKRKHCVGAILACSRLLDRRAKERARGRKPVPPRFRPLALSFARLSRSLEQARAKRNYIYGVLKFTSSGLNLNHQIIIRKYFLYINAVQDDKRPQFTDFVTLVNEKIEQKNTLRLRQIAYFLLIKKWSNFLNN